MLKTKMILQYNDLIRMPRRVENVRSEDDKNNN